MPNDNTEYTMTYNGPLFIPDSSISTIIDDWSETSTDAFSTTISNNETDKDSTYAIYQ